MKNKNAFCLLLLGVAVVPVASATSIGEAIKMALETNPDIRVETNEVLSRQEEIRQAKAGYYPEVDLTTGVGIEHSDNRATRAAGFDKRELTRKEAAIHLRQMLFDGYATRSEVERQTAREESAQYRVAGVSQNTALAAVEVYLDVLESEKLLQLSRANLDAHSRIFDQVALLSKAGRGRGSDLEQVKGRRASANASRLADVANLKDAESRYLRVVGDLPRDLVSAKSLHAQLPTTLDAAIQAALADHPTLRSANADVRATLAQKKAAGNAFYPRFDLEVGGTWGENEDGIVGEEKDMTAMVRMRYNLFAGGKDKARQRQTAHLIDEAKEVRNRTYRQVVESLRLSWTAYQATQAQLASLQQHLISSEKTRDAYAMQFSIGKRTLIDLLNTETEVFEAQRAHLDAETDNLFAQYRILVGMGHLLEKLDLSTPEGEGAGDEELGPQRLLAPQTVLASNFDAKINLDSQPDKATVDPGILTHINAWKAAWEGQDVEAYLASYDSSFTPDKGQSLTLWKAQRRLIIGAAKEISIKLDAIDVQQNADRATVEFTQRYRSSSYADVVNKRLGLSRQSGSWRIVSETAN